MRYVIFGAGAIGGTIAAALQLRDRHVILIARNLHLQALQQRGLTFIVPGQTHALSVTAVAEPADIQITSDDVVVLAVKSQQTATALTALRAATTGEPAIVCAQNGVENERQALRLFSRVYGMEVVMPATHLEPGIVEAHYRDVYGLLDFGRFPSAVSWPPNSATAPVTANSSHT